MKNDKTDRRSCVTQVPQDDNVALKYNIVTFGCQQNTADSERIGACFEARGYVPVDSWKKADVVVINTCMVRQMAEDRVYGLVRNIVQYFQNPFDLDSHGLKKRSPRIIVTGCMVGLAQADKTGKIIARLRERMPGVEFMPNSKFEIRNLKKIGNSKFKIKNKKQDTALVIISNGCNNFCTYCVVPFARGREVSRPWGDIINECAKLKEQGVKSVMLLGQNVNSWGANLILSNTNQYYPILTNTNKKNNVIPAKAGILKTKIPDRASLVRNDNLLKENNSAMKPVMVKHLGRYRIPTLFPYLLDAVAKMGFENVNFMSSNPWDFSDELIDVIARNPNITRTIHLPVQSGDDEILKKMNRWYTAADYIGLVKSLKFKVQSLKLTTDIIVGFPGETEAQFKNTVKLCKKVSFEKAYISLYSPRPLTIASKNFPDDLPHAVKKKRWEVLETMINRR